MILSLVISGIATGAIYSLVGITYVLIYKATKVLNFAQGELLMLGAYLVFSFLTIGIPFWITLIISVLLLGLIGILIERVFLRKMIGEPIFSVIMLTIGLSVFLRGVAALFWGPYTKTFVIPFANSILTIAGTSVSYLHIFAIAIALITFVMLSLFFRYSKIGIAMRATATDQDTAMLMGVNVNHVFGISWGMASGIAVFAGIFLGGLNFLHPIMGEFAFKAFPVIILGGFDSIPGAVLAGFFLGVVENIAGVYLDHFIGGGAKEMLSYVLLLIILMVMPYGFFGTKKIERA